MGVIIGSLAGQNWHRQVRQRGLTGREAFYYAFDKTVEVGKRARCGRGRRKHASQGVIIFGQDRVKFVIVAARTSHGKTEQTTGNGVNALIPSICVQGFDYVF